MNAVGCFVIVTLERDGDPSLVRAQLVSRGLWVRRFDGSGSVQFLVEPQSASVARDDLLRIAGVSDVSVSKSSTPLLDAHPPLIHVRGLALGVGAPPVLMAGPCSVETEDRIGRLAGRVAAAGATFLRGGAFKPRTSPYDFQGLGETALQWLRRAADAHGLRVVTEVLAPSDVTLVAEYADMLQVGARNMHNAPLLRAAGASGLPVLIKRGMAATVEEWCAAAETALLHGASGVVLCERGIRGYEPSTRFTLDFGAVALISHVLRLPVIVDPSHGAGRRDLVVPLSRAALAAGAAGLLIEAHDAPGEAWSDGPQALSLEALDALGRELFCGEGRVDRNRRSATGDLRSRVA